MFTWDDLFEIAIKGVKRTKRDYSRRKKTY